MKRLKRATLVLGAVLVVGAAAFGLLRWRGWLLFPDEAGPNRWEIWGVDVSSYQGEVDWTVLRDQGVDFAFIKATEGSGMVDRCFAENWEKAQDAGVLAGAYHFFSYDSPGEAQADNFIAQVPVTAGALPPAVDIEFYGDKAENPPDLEAVRGILDPLLEKLEAQYGQKPILYVTYRTYQLYIKGEYEDYPLWVTRPLLAPVDKNWTFWQYSHSARLSGYQGKEDRIDLNVFRGSREELEGMRAEREEAWTDKPKEEETAPSPTGEPEGKTFQQEAADIFNTLRSDAYPGLAEYGLDLDQMEEDLYTYVEARSALEAYLACVQDDTLDLETAKAQAKEEHYGDFVQGIQDAYQYEEEPKSRKIELDNPIDPWTKKWLYLDGVTLAMNTDAATEREIWRMEWENVCDALEKKLDGQEEWKKTAQAARAALLEFAPAYGHCIALLEFSPAFSPEWWQGETDFMLMTGTLAGSARHSEAADYFRRETLLLWQKLGAEDAAWAFEALGYEAELTERYEQIYGKDISEFQMAVEEARQ